MPRPPVIALIGIDGAGKTTQARAVAAWLGHRGVRADFLRNPGGRLRLDRIARGLGRRNAISLLGRHGFLVVEVIVRWWMIARALVWSRLSRRVAVMDRYTYCQYAAIRARGDRGERFARALYALFPRPDVVFLLAAAPGEAWRRIRTRGADVEDVAYLESLDTAYRSLPEADGFTMVDANGPPDQVQRALREIVEEHLEPAATGRR